MNIDALTGTNTDINPNPCQGPGIPEPTCEVFADTFTRISSDSGLPVNDWLLRPVEPGTMTELKGGTIVHPWQVWFTAAGFRATTSFNPGPMQCFLQGLLIVNGQLQISSTGASGVTFQVRAFVTPALFWGSCILYRSQFSEYKLVDDTSTGGNDIIRCGPAVLIHQWDPNWNGLGQCYYLELRVETGEMVLYRTMNDLGVGTGLTPLVTGMPVAKGDILRLDVVIQSGQNSLTVKRNNIVVGTYIDNALARPRFGYPGIAVAFQGTNAAFQTIDNYVGGPV